jgi:hypothetical protein
MLVTAAFVAMIHGAYHLLGGQLGQQLATPVIAEISDQKSARNRLQSPSDPSVTCRP